MSQLINALWKMPKLKFIIYQEASRVTPTEKL
jgi:hypothetical protein